MAHEEQGQGGIRGPDLGDLSDDGENMDMDSDVDLREDHVQDGATTPDGAAFQPYRSILPGLSSPSSSLPLTRQVSPCTSSSTSRKRRRVGDTERSEVLPPWRSALGRGYFSLPSDENDTHSLLPTEAEDTFISILESTFAHFSDQPVGSDIQLVKVEDSNGTAEEVSWETDVTRQRGIIAGDAEVLYTSLFNLPLEVNSTDTLRKSLSSRMSNRACWNCGDTSHQLADCPLPRNYNNINSARIAFARQKEIDERSMPQHHKPYLHSYTCTTEDKERRLKLARRFRKIGQPSETLLDAVFWVEPDNEGVYEEGEDETERYRRAEDRLRMRVQRNKKEMPWYIWMIKWGYPPGWLASKDPVEEAIRRIKLEPLEDDLEDASDDEDDLVVYADEDSLPQPLASEQPRPTSPPAPPPPPPADPDEPPPPPPPVERPYRRWWELAPPRGHDRPAPPTRWAEYDTDVFSSERLRPHDPTHPFPFPVARRL